MVKNRELVAILFTVFALVPFACTCSAQSRQYYLGQEWVKIWINPDVSIDLFYNVSITLESGPTIHYVLIGQPKSDFTIDQAVDQYARSLPTTDASSGSDYAAQVNFTEPLGAGQTVWFTLMTNVTHMIYEDNKTNVGMQFTPTWWSQARVLDLRVSIVLPLGVNVSMVGTSIEYWDNVSNETDGRLSVFWERQNLEPTTKYSFGGSFPKEFVQEYDTQPPHGFSIDFSSFAPYIVGFLFLIGFIFIVVVGIIAASKKQYLSPQIRLETLGVKHGLTAVEASYLLDLKPAKIVTEILYNLLKKRAVWVEATKPSIKLRIMPDFQSKTGTSETPLRYYEID